ncbi:hypothetical protein [Streptomyces sp. V4I23]|uniref:hypothetical protein n=1 Tax=Streptomyces sp. V4I23 TaxID=3042282 RepID=UPI00358EC113
MSDRRILRAWTRRALNAGPATPGDILRARYRRRLPELADAHGSMLLTTHHRAVGRGARVVDETHWDGLPTGEGRRTTTGDIPVQPRHERPRGEETGPLQALLNRLRPPRSRPGTDRCRSMTS